LNKKLQLLGNKKALSQIVSSLLFLAIVTILCITIYGWAVSTVGNAQDVSNAIYGYKQNALKERFILEYVFFTDTDGNPDDHKNVTIYLRNIGTTNIIIAEIDLNGTTTLMTNPTLPQTLVPNQGSELSTTLANPWSSNSTNHIIVMSDSGSMVQGYWKAP
jgi:hypothetical protein